MNFMEVMGPYATPDEIDACAWHLAQFRMKKTYEALRWKGSVASRTAATKVARASLDRDFPKRAKKGLHQ
jgi:hypothetical protein